MTRKGTTLCVRKGFDSRPFASRFHEAQKSARLRSIPREWSLTYEEYLTFVGQRCHYCEAELNWEPHGSRNARKSNLDRKDNSVDYTKDNCVACCWKCNHDCMFLTYNEKRAVGAIRKGNV